MRAVTQKRPQGPGWPVDRKWKENVLAELKARGWTQADLAVRVGATAGAISYLLNATRSQLQSRLVPAIHAALGWPEPLPASTTDDLDDIRGLWKELTPEQRELVRTLAEQFLRKK